MFLYYRSHSKSSSKGIDRLTKELEKERRVNASLRNELQLVHNRNNSCRNLTGWVEEELDTEENNFFRQRNSTMRAADESSVFTSMTLASLQIAECKPLEGEDEIDKKSFEQWRDVLESALKIASITDESMRYSIFRMKAGAKLIDVLENTPDIDNPDEETLPYSNVMFRLREYYGSRDYTLLQRQKLKAMTQGKTESDFKFVKRLATVAKLCDYSPEQMVETVADVVQARAVNPKARAAARKIIRKEGTLQYLINKLRAAEIEKQNEDLFAKNHQTNTAAEIAAVSYSNYRSTQNYGRGFTRNYRGRGTFPRGRGGFLHSNAMTSENSKPCWRCTGNFHLPTRCFAVDKICHRCKVKGHIERACNEPEKPKRRAGDVDSNSAPKQKIAAIMATEEKEMNENEDKKPVSVEP